MPTVMKRLSSTTPNKLEKTETATHNQRAAKCPANHWPALISCAALNAEKVIRIEKNNANLKLKRI